MALIGTGTTGGGGGGGLPSWWTLDDSPGASSVSMNPTGTTISLPLYRLDSQGIRLFGEVASQVVTVVDGADTDLFRIFSNGSADISGLLIGGFPTQADLIGIQIYQIAAQASDLFRAFQVDGSTIAVQITNTGEVTMNPASGNPLTILGLATADPHVAGALWSSSGTVHVSAG